MKDEEGRRYENPDTSGWRPVKLTVNKYVLELTRSLPRRVGVLICLPPPEKIHGDAGEHEQVTNAGC